MRIQYTFYIILLFSSLGFAQTNTNYSMFVFNKLQFNPAYAGSANALTAGAHYRHQWQGVFGAPRTITAFAHTPIAGKRNGVGLSITTDEIGIFNTVYTNAAYAYKIDLKNDHRISLGLNAQVEYVRFDWTKADLVDQIDSAIPFGAASNSAINFGLGIYYEGPQFYVGLSVPQLLRNALSTDVIYNNFKELNPLKTYYLMGGMVFPINDNIHIRPSLAISYVQNAPMEADFNLSVLFLKSFWVGASYRLEESANLFVQVPIMDQLKVALGVDYTLAELNAITKGSFEVMIEYTLSNSNKGRKVDNIRFF